jgi:hypothetical protein
LIKCQIDLFASHGASYDGMRRAIGEKGWGGLCTIDVKDIPTKTPTKPEVRSIRRNVEFLKSLPDKCKDAPLHLSIFTDKPGISTKRCMANPPFPMIRQHFALEPFAHFFAQSFD